MMIMIVFINYRIIPPSLAQQLYKVGTLTGHCYHKNNSRVSQISLSHSRCPPPRSPRAPGWSGRRAPPACPGDLRRGPSAGPSRFPLACVLFSCFETKLSPKREIIYYD